MAEDKDPRLRPIETNPSKMREKAQQQLKDEAADEARRKRNLRLVQKAKVSEELDSLKRKIRAFPGFEDLYTRQIEALVSEAYKDQPK